MAERILDGKFKVVAECVCLDYTGSIVQDASGDVKISIVKMSNNDPIPEDEPVFLFRGRDRLAIEALFAYQQACNKDGCTDYQILMLDEQINKFIQFQKDHPERMKQPGITRGL